MDEEASPPARDPYCLPGTIRLLTARQGQLEFQRCVFAIGPLPHGGVVVLGLVVANQLQDEHTVRRTDAALSIRIDLLVG